MGGSKVSECPQCNKTIYIRREVEGWNEVCLSCGYRKNLSVIIIFNTVGQARLQTVCEINRETTLEHELKDSPMQYNPN
jgi:DNA-directed RNA polymerase subunit M/transcription elongation factor TFIIS